MPAQKARVRRYFPAILFALVLLPTRSSLPPQFGLAGGWIAIDAKPVTLDPRDPEKDHVGDLTFVRGWALTSPSSQFGALSALRAWHGRWLAAMDTGALISFRPGEQRAWIVPLNPRCNPNRVRMGRDTEGLDTDGRAIWISSEWHNTICRREADGTQTGVRPAAMADWPRYSGPETLLRLRDGRFLIIPEDASYAALLFPGDPVRGGKPRRLQYSPPTGYMPTDAAELPDGRIVILNRAFGLSGFKAKLVLLDALPTHGVMQGRTIATLERPLIHDNFEGIAARREGDATVLTIVSDDNESWFQRTLLLEFRLNR